MLVEKASTAPSASESLAQSMSLTTDIVLARRVESIPEMLRSGPDKRPKYSACASNRHYVIA